MDYKKLYHDVMQTFHEVIDDLNYQLESIEEDMRAGERGVGIQLKQREVGTKIKMLREAICYMESAEEEEKGASDEG